MSSCMYRTAEDSAFANIRADVQNRLARGLEKPAFIYATSYRRLIGWLKSYHPEAQVNYAKLAGLHVEERDNQLMTESESEHWRPFNANDFEQLADYIQANFVKLGVVVNK